MSLASTTVFEVRSDGTSTAGGGFNPSRVNAGTDRSQQAAVQQAYTDLAIDAADTTLISSAAHPFSSADIGNLINLTGGVGFTTGRCEITSVDGSSRAVLDRSAGTGGSTGGTGNLGGALDGLATVASLVVAGNTTYVRAGSGYTSAATITLSRDSSDNLACVYEGYTTTRGDGGLATITSTNAAATSLISVTGKGSILKNLKGDGASLSQRVFNAADVTVTFDNCYALGGTKYGFRGASTQSIFRRCLATGNGASGGDAGFSADTGTALFDRCVSRGNAGNGFSSLTAGVATCLNCIASGNTLSGFQSNDNESVIRVLNCTSYLNTLDGLRFAAVSTFVGVFVRNSIFAGNAGYGIRSISTDYNLSMFATLFENNAFWNNTLGARYQVPTGADDITLTADPFAARTNSDFSLNLVEGGGLELRTAGVPSGFGLRAIPETSVGYEDIGAVPSGGATSSSDTASPGLGTMRSLWRELTGEKDTTVVPNAVVDIYLQRGLEELNRLVRYHFTDDDSNVTLVAGTQEYSLPAACNQVVFVTWRGQELKKSSVDEWRSKGVAWQQQSGEPREWAMYGDKLVFFPTPNAEAVAADPNPVVRYVSNPSDIGTSGPEQLRSGDYALPVYHGVVLWSASYPDSAAAQGRLAFYEGLFDKEAGKCLEYYSARLVTR
jgi:hypothetical protein